MDDVKYAVHGETPQPVEAEVISSANPKHPLSCSNQTPLHHACIRRCFSESGDSVAKLIAVKADPNAADDKGQTPLHIAAYNHDMTAIELLVEGGANANLRDNVRELRTAPFSAACEHPLQRVMNVTLLSHVPCACRARACAGWPSAD